MNTYNSVISNLNNHPNVWLITGVAGFIGSNLLEKLLKINQKVIGIDNFSTGFTENLDEVRSIVSKENWSNFKFIEGDICNLEECIYSCQGVDYVLHQAALGSVTRSISNPLLTNEVNIKGFLNMLVAGRDSKVKSFVYASSSSIYGDQLELPKVEEKIGNPLSPYAVTKYVNELYAKVFSQTYGLQIIGLRYFNAFGPRQDPNGPYAAVIPKWTSSMIKGEKVEINGDGETSRDFCYISNIVQANILAATSSLSKRSEIFNIAVGGRTSLNDLFCFIQNSLDQIGKRYNKKAEYLDFRLGDIRHSEADISKAKKILGYEPSHDIKSGICEAMPWYLDNV